MKIIKVTIENLGYNGMGCAFYENKPVFVPKTMPNEEVKIEIVKEYAKYSFGKIIEIISKNNNRIIPPCPYFNICGGCDYMQMPYEMELNLKKQIFLREFGKAYKINDVEIVSENELEYRNKISFDIIDNHISMHNEFDNSLFFVNSCKLINEKMNITIKIVQEFLLNTPNKFTKVTLKYSDNNILLDLSTIEKVDCSNLIKSLDKSYIVTINNKDLVFGKGNLKKTILGVEFDVLGDAFTQINDKIANKLYSQIQESACNLDILNAYSGNGVLSVILAKKAKSVYAIESNEKAHGVANSLKAKNKILNLTNICGLCEKEIFNIKQKYDLVVVDPPRKGCNIKFLEAILKNNIPQIIYVSCNISTCARDLKILSSKYDLTNVKLFDMFPRTSNVEVFCHLTIK